MASQACQLNIERFYRYTRKPLAGVFYPKVKLVHVVTVCQGVCLILQSRSWDEVVLCQDTYTVNFNSQFNLLLN